MKHLLCLLSILSVCLLQMEAKPKKKAQTLSSFVYIVKGFEAFYSGPDEITVVGPDINSVIKMYAAPQLPLSYLESDAIKVVDGLADQD